MAGQRQRASAEVPRSRFKHTDACSSNLQVLCAPALAKEAKGSHHCQDSGGPVTSASRTSEDGAETPEKQGSNDTDVSVCTRVCTKCCRTLTIADKATADALMSMASALQELIAQNDCSESEKNQPNTNNEQAGSALLETIRLLAKLSPDERAALIGLLNALG